MIPPAAAAAVTRPGVEVPPAIGATITGHRAKRGSRSGMIPRVPWNHGPWRDSGPRSYPAVEPHARHPGAEQQRLPGENRIQVVEVGDDREQVAAGDRRADGPAVRPGPGRAEDQAEAHGDRNHQEWVEHHGVVVELGAVVV